MSTGMGTTAGDQVAPGAPQPTHIDVHIHQDSLLLNFLRQPSAPDYPTPSQPLGSKRVLLGSKRVLVASWVAQIVLGLLSGALGGLGRFLYDDWVIWFTYEAGIWTGVMAMLAGVTVFIFDKRGGTCWALLKTLFALASFGTAIAAIQIGASHFDYLFYWYTNWCGLPDPWRETTLPPRDPEEAHRKDLCLSHQYMIQNLSIGLQIILLSIWALLLLASLAPVLLFCWRRLRSKKKDQKALLGSE